jgi:hypothetical protein
VPVRLRSARRRRSFRPKDFAALAQKVAAESAEQIKSQAAKVLKLPV